MTRLEREAYIENQTGQKIDHQEMVKNTLHYYGESGALIAKYNPLKGTLIINK